MKLLYTLFLIICFIVLHAQKQQTNENNNSFYRSKEDYGKPDEENRRKKIEEGYEKIYDKKYVNTFTDDEYKERIKLQEQSYNKTVKDLKRKIK